MDNKDHLPYLDGWRGLAIALVLLQHFWGVHNPDVGRFGVDLFFVLSGLLMSRILFEQRMPVAKFYRRRIARILPVFLLFVTVCWIGWGDQASQWELWTTLTFTRTYFYHPMIWHSAVPDGNLWSLNIEEHCYVLLALIAAFVSSRRHVVPILFGLALLTLAAVKIHMHFWTDVPKFPYMLTTECAAGGLLLSAAYRQVKRWTAPGWAAPLALSLAVLCYLTRVPWDVHVYAQYVASPLLLAFSVNHIQDSWGWVVRALEFSPLRRLGVLSYSIYLWQQIFYKHARYFPHHTAILFALAAGCASFYLFERPARQWLNTRWGAKSAPLPVPALN